MLRNWRFTAIGQAPAEDIFAARFLCRAGFIEARAIRPQAADLQPLYVAIKGLP
jgi:hypothetical protein